MSWRSSSSSALRSMRSNARCEDRDSPNALSCDSTPCDFRSSLAVLATARWLGRGNRGPRESRSLARTSQRPATLHGTAAQTKNPDCITQAGLFAPWTGHGVYCIPLPALPALTTRFVRPSGPCTCGSALGIPRSMHMLTPHASCRACVREPAKGGRAAVMNGPAPNAIAPASPLRFSGLELLRCIVNPCSPTSPRKGKRVADACRFSLESPANTRARTRTRATHPVRLDR